MNKRTKVAVISALAVLGVGTVVFAQAGGGNSRQNGEPADPFKLEERYGCRTPGGNLGGGLGGCGGGYGSDNFDDGSGNGYGGSGFSCH